MGSAIAEIDDCARTASRAHVQKSAPQDDRELLGGIKAGSRTKLGDIGELELGLRGFGLWVDFGEDGDGGRYEYRHRLFGTLLSMSFAH